MWYLFLQSNWGECCGGGGAASPDPPRPGGRCWRWGGWWPLLAHRPAAHSSQEPGPRVWRAFCETGVSDGALGKQSLELILKWLLLNIKCWRKSAKSISGSKTVTSVFFFVNRGEAPREMYQIKKTLRLVGGAFPFPFPPTVFFIFQWPLTLTCVEF